MSTIYADLVRLESVLERAASGIGGLLERADGGPLSWPTVEARLLEVYEILGEARMPLAVDRLEQDFRRAEILATDLRQKDPCRLWAIENGYPVEKHGRISNRIREEYEAYLESNRVAAAILEQQQRRTA